MSDFWKILRILTTNQCNYRCLYCHNEGQEKRQCVETLSFESFVKIARAIEGTGFREVRFSGGEPLVNPKTIEMIEWLNENSDYEIGLATNSSLITDDIARRLGKTRTLVTVHFPAAKDSEYMRVTGRPMDSFLKATELLDKYNVSHSFNFVLYPETVNNIDDVINYSISHQKRIKLLPFIEREFNNRSVDIIEVVKSRLNATAKNIRRFDAEGITTWEYENGGKVKLIDSPCYSRDIATCREYGELRLLPDLSLQKCIFDENPISIREMDDNQIRKIILDVWQSFDKCL